VKNKYYRKIIYVIGCCAVMSLTAGSLAVQEGECGEVVDRIVALVNDDIITLSELNRLFGPYEEKIRALGYPFDQEQQLLFQARNDALNKIIDQKLADQEIKRSNITIDEQEIDEKVKMTTTLLEPVMILVVGFIVGFIVFAMLLPIFQVDVFA